MFQPPSQKRSRPAVLSGTMVSYAEVKSYLSKREIPQLFESLMAGLMYHRPENHIGYLQSCLDEVRSNADSKVQWSTFVNRTRKRKSKEILPPLTPIKPDSFPDSRSNSRQSTPLPPISARTRSRTEDTARNTYILYHNPPPLLAKPKVPVVSVVGGLGSAVDGLCARAVGRLRGVVHLSTGGMLRTRMAVEGFNRVTAVPACAVVDSVLQAMSMVQSSEALIVAGFPRNRGDVEEYRSRQVRMDGVILIDFEEEALRGFLQREVSSGAIRATEIDSELERYKQDIISVAEYYDDKELLTVVMGDQDFEETVDDLVIAIDKVIETRKDLDEEESVNGARRGDKCEPCKSLMASPQSLERPSTVEIVDVTEEETAEAHLSTRGLATAGDVESNDVDCNRNEAGVPSCVENNEPSDDTNAQIDERQAIESETETVPAIESETETAPDIEPEIEIVSVIDSETETVQASGSEMNDVQATELESNGVQAIESETNVVQAIESETNVVQADTSETGVVEADKSETNVGPAIDSENQDPNDDGITPFDSEIPENISNTMPDDNGMMRPNTNGDSGDDELSEKRPKSEEGKKDCEDQNVKVVDAKKSDLPLVFAFQNIQADSESIKNVVVNEVGMCFIDFRELTRDDGNEEDTLGPVETLELLQSVLSQDSVSYSRGFFIWKFPLTLMHEVEFKNVIKLGDVSFVCKIKENEDNPVHDKFFHSPFNDRIRLIFVSEHNILKEIEVALKGIVRKRESEVNEEPTDANTNETLENNNDISNSDINEIGNTEVRGSEYITEQKENETNAAVEKNEEIKADDKNSDAEDNSIPIKDEENSVGDDVGREEELDPRGGTPSETVNNDKDLEKEQESNEETSREETPVDRTRLKRQTHLDAVAEYESDNEDENKISERPTERDPSMFVRQATFSADALKKDNQDNEKSGKENEENEQYDIQLADTENQSNDLTNNVISNFENITEIEGDDIESATLDNVTKEEDENENQVEENSEEKAVELEKETEIEDNSHSTTKSTMDIAKVTETDVQQTPEDTEVEVTESENKEENENDERTEVSDNENVVDEAENENKSDEKDEGNKKDSNEKVDVETVETVNEDDVENEARSEMCEDENITEVDVVMNESNDDTEKVEPTKTGDAEELIEAETEERENNDETENVELNEAREDENTNDRGAETENSEEPIEQTDTDDNDDDNRCEGNERENEEEENGKNKDNAVDEEDLKPDSVNDLGLKDSENNNTTSQAIEKLVSFPKDVDILPSELLSSLNTTSISIKNESGVSQCISLSSEQQRTVLIETTAEIHAFEDDEVLTVSISEIESYSNQVPTTQPAEEIDAVLVEDSTLNLDNLTREVETNEDENVSPKRSPKSEGEITTSLTIIERESSGEDRYSNKRLERNGSGILGEGRQEEQQVGEEEHQERSSSSSRGEL